MQEKEILQSAMMPTTNPLTDRFGAMRDWALPGERDPDTGRLGWSPASSYRPIHYGADYSARPDSELIAMTTAWVQGVPLGGDSLTLHLPIVDSRGTSSRRCIIYWRHAQPVLYRWTEHLQGKPISNHGPSTMWAAHLHLEIAVTMDLYEQLPVNRERVCLEELVDKARARDMDVDAVMTRVSGQIETDGIIRIERGAIIRRGLPAYRRADEWSDVGTGEVAIVDPVEVIGG